MNVELLTSAGVIAALVLIVSIFIFKRRPRKLKVVKFERKWKELQKYCADQETWGKAVTAADGLLDLALKRRRYSGKSMGERLASAQRDLSNNDTVWFAHNLSKKIRENPGLTPKQQDVKNALLGFGQALKDLGAL